MEFSRKNKECVIGIIKINRIQTWVFSLNSEYLNFEFCLKVGQDQVLDFSIASSKSYEFLILSNDSVTDYRRFDKEIQTLNTECFTKDKKVMLARFMGLKDYIWMFYSDSTIEVFESKFKKLLCIKSISKPTMLWPTKTGFLLANKNFEFEKFDLDFKTNIESVYKKNKIILSSEAKSILNEEELQACYFSDRQKKIVFRCHSGMLGQLKKKRQNSQYETEILWEKAHSHKFVDFDVCLSKPWIVSIGQDKTLTIWNYLKKRVEMTWNLNEELLSVSIHPQGYFICLGMGDKAVVFTLLANSVREFQKKVLKEIFLKNVYKVQFSKGGNYLVICSENPNAVNVFQFYSMHCPSFLALKGHTSKVQDIHFSRFNGFLYTCSKDGLLYKWSLKDGTRQEMFSRGPSLLGMTLFKKKEGMRVVAVSDETAGLIQMEEGKKKISPGEWAMTCILYCKQSDRIFVGLKHPELAKCGSIRMFNESEELDKFQDFPVHDKKGVRKILFTNHGACLVSMGFDNSLAVMDIRGNQEELEMTNKVLVTKRYIENLRSEVAYLTTSLDDDKGLNNNIITLSHLDDQIKKLKEKIEEKEKVHSEEINKKTQEKEKCKNTHDQKLKELNEKNENDISDLSNFHAKKISNRNRELGKNCN